MSGVTIFDLSLKWKWLCFHFSYLHATKVTMHNSQNDHCLVLYVNKANIDILMCGIALSQLDSHMVNGGCCHFKYGTCRIFFWMNCYEISCDDTLQCWEKEEKEENLGSPLPSRGPVWDLLVDWTFYRH